MILDDDNNKNTLLNETHLSFLHKLFSPFSVVIRLTKLANLIIQPEYDKDEDLEVIELIEFRQKQTGIWKGSLQPSGQTWCMELYNCKHAKELLYARATASVHTTLILPAKLFSLEYCHSKSI